MIIKTHSCFVLLFLITSVVIYLIYTNKDDIKFNIHSIIGATFENFNNTVDYVNLPKNIVDISLNDIIKTNNPINKLKTEDSQYCFIGDDKGRYCAKVDHTDKCMSGEQFTTKQQCMFPNLRY
jgi:hypothetical protein